MEISQLKIKEHRFKNEEYDQETRAFITHIQKLKTENEQLTNSIQKLKVEKQKLEDDNSEEYVKREAYRKLQSKMTEIINILGRVKQHYNQGINNIRIEVDNMTSFYQSKDTD